MRDNSPEAVAYPPVWSIYRERQVVDDMVAVFAAVGKMLYPGGKAGQA